jgi:hypothetical protein
MMSYIQFFLSYILYPVKVTALISSLLQLQNSHLSVENNVEICDRSYMIIFSAAAKEKEFADENLSRPC